MRPLIRAASRLSFVRQLQSERARLAAEVEQLLFQRGVLASDRDELAAHCRRLERQLGEALDRERLFRGECAVLTEVRTALTTERDQLSAHARRLDDELAAALSREERLRAEHDALLEAHDALERERNDLAAGLLSGQDLLELMRREWDSRAGGNALYYTNSATPAWDEASYFATGEANVSEQIRNDMPNICQGVDPRHMRILEIGCGAGRMTRALAGIFGEVHAVDISAEMIRVARQNLADIPNALFYRNNGMDLSVVPDGPYDFAFSFIVFQHVPSKTVIESYVREAHRLLKPGALFKFQVQGSRPRGQRPADTWLGVDFSLEEIEQLAARCGFELRFHHGAGTQYFWAWFFRRP